MPPGIQVPITAFSRYEHIDYVPFVENTPQSLPTNGGLLPNDRFMSHLILEFRGRLTMPAATGPTASQADPTATIIERVQIEGYHRVRKQQEKFIDLRGSDLARLQTFMLPGGLVNTPTAINVGANQTNDICFQLIVPFTPLRMPVQVQAGYLLDCPNYESLKMTIQWGDQRNIVVPGATPAVWTAFGSAAGTPQLRVAGSFSIQPARFANFVPGRIWRYFTEVVGTIPITTNSESRLWDLPKGYDIRNVLVKTGTKATNTTAGNNSYATYADFLTDIKLNLGLGKYVRRWLDGNGLQADIAPCYNSPAVRSVGISLIDFAKYGAPGEVLATRPFVSGPTGNVDLYLAADVTGAANQAMTFAIEEWRYRPM